MSYVNFILNVVDVLTLVALWTVGVLALRRANRRYAEQMQMHEELLLSIEEYARAVRQQLGGDKGVG